MAKHSRKLRLPRGVTALNLLGKGLTSKQRVALIKKLFGASSTLTSSEYPLWVRRRKGASKSSSWEQDRSFGDYDYLSTRAKVIYNRYSRAKTYKDIVQGRLGRYGIVFTKGRNITKVITTGAGAVEKIEREVFKREKLIKVRTRAEYDARNRAIQVGGQAELDHEEYADFDKDLSVTFTPMWTAAKIRRRYTKRYEGMDEAGQSIYRKGRRIEDTLYNRKQLNKYYLQSVFSGRKMDISISVGFLDPDMIHMSYSGSKNNISYKTLVARLMLLGYDPLAPLRDTEYIKDVRIRMGEELGRVLDDPSKYKRRLSSYIMKYAKEVREVAYAYVIGGIKPPLAESTVKQRKSRAKTHSGLYAEGISEPLVETGNMANDISYRIDENVVEGRRKNISGTLSSDSALRRNQDILKKVKENVNDKKRAVKKRSKTTDDIEIDIDSDEAKELIARANAFLEELGL